jgi:NDP-sugar pyrophosphorylase family protein
MSLQVVILAGGMATRLGDRTKNIPKSLIEVNGKKFIDYQLSQLASFEFTNVVICTGHLGHLIEEYVQDGEKWNIKVQYSRESKELLGTGGAIKNALPLLDEKFAVLYGDSYLTENLGLISNLQSHNPCIMTIYENVNGTDRSNVFFESPEKWSYSKSKKIFEANYIDYGFMILDRNFFGQYESRSKFDLSEFLEFCCKNGLIEPLIVNSGYFEIGSEEGISSFTTYLDKQYPKQF